MTKSEAKRLKLTKSLAEAHALADAVLSRARRASARHAPSRRARDSKRAAKRDVRATIRALVLSRSGGRCEAWHSEAPGSPNAVRCFGKALEWDHFWSRRDPADETVEGTWMLCTHCHQRKTDSDPDRRAWLSTFWFHCSRWGYGEQMLRAVNVRALEEAQHPETTR